MKKLKNALKIIEKYLGDDREALEAIDVLYEKAEEILEEEEGEVSGDLNLPKNFTGDYALFSDGACRGNPGPGAWGMIGQNAQSKVLFQASGVDMVTTNNRMELEGAIQALEALLMEDADAFKKKVYLFSDSKYVVDGIEKWVPGWKRRGWKKADNKAPENLDQWQTLDDLVVRFKMLKFQWVKGHAGHPQNELCDQLANDALDDAGL